jgi:phage tail P2-like protein
MTNRTDVKLAEILPANLNRDPQVESMAKAVQPQLDEINEAIPLLEIYKLIDDPLDVLRMLALENQLYKDEWDLATTIEEKRELVKQSFNLNMRRGTRWAVERVLQLVTGVTGVEEWFEYGGQPYHFRVTLDINEGAISTEQILQASRLVRRYKPLRSPLEAFEVQTKAETVTGYAGAANTMIAQLDCLAYPELNGNFNAKSGVATGVTLISETYPQT